MSVRFKWEGLPGFNRGLLDQLDDARDAAHDIVAKGLAKMEENIKRRAGEGGRHRRGTRTPARRGGGPAVITGTLRRSVRVSPITSRGPLGFQGEVGPTTVYGRRVELEYDYPYTGPGANDALSWIRWYAGRRWSAGSGGSRRSSVR